MPATVAAKIDKLLGDILVVWIWTGAADMKMLLRSAYFQGIIDVLKHRRTTPKNRQASQGRNTTA